MNQSTDQQLLREYAERGSEAAFTEVVRRHVDLVYSAALRMVRDSHLTEVTQGAFALSCIRLVATRASQYVSLEKRLGGDKQKKRMADGCLLPIRSARWNAGGVIAAR